MSLKCGYGVGVTWTPRTTNVSILNEVKSLVYDMQADLEILRLHLTTRQHGKSCTGKTENRDIPRRYYLNVRLYLSLLAYTPLRFAPHTKKEEKKMNERTKQNNLKREKSC